MRAEHPGSGWGGLFLVSRGSGGLGEAAGAPPVPRVCGPPALTLSPSHASSPLPCPRAPGPGIGPAR